MCFGTLTGRGVGWKGILNLWGMVFGDARINVRVEGEEMLRASKGTVSHLSVDSICSKNDSNSLLIPSNPVSMCYIV